MEFNLTVWICISWAFCFTSTECSNGDNNACESYLPLIVFKQKTIANCTQYIPKDEQHWMRENKPAKYPDNTEIMLVPSEYLYACLNAELPHVKDSPPFELVSNPLICYNIGLNQVVSLGFDGILTTKALIFHIFEYEFITSV